MLLVGERIRNAREALGLKQEELATQIGIPRTGLSAIENGKRQVTSSELIRFGAALSRPFIYFLDQSRKPIDFQPLFRVAASAQRGPAEADLGQLRRTIVQFEEICQLYLDLEERGGLVHPAVPPFAVGPSRFVAREAERLADLVRVQLGLGGDASAGQLREVLEERFFIKTFVLRSESRLSGASIYHERLGGCILISERLPQHMLFTLAHELAHVLLHRESPSVDEDLDRRAPAEQMANAFAASLLMPKAGVIEMFFSLCGPDQKITGIEAARMARYFGTSLSAMLWRLQGLRLITPGDRDAALRSSRAAPASRPSPSGWAAMPERYLYLALRAYQRDQITLGRLAEYLYHVDGTRYTDDEAEALVQMYEVAAEDVTRR